MKVCGHEIRVQGKLLKVARLEGDLYHFLDNPEEMLDGLRQCEERIDLFTFIQKLPDSTPKYSYPIEWDNVAAVPVSTYDQWWKSQITSEARNRARQAEKRGVVLRVVPFDDTLAKGIWEIYNESPIRRGRKFPHYGKNYETVYREAATFLDDSAFIGAYFEDKLIGFVKITADQSRTQANLMNILSTIHHREKAPTNALIAHSVRYCADNNIGYLVYQRFSYGKKKDDGIAKFKEVNGFKRFDLPRYFVPLTSVGRAALQLGLHRKLADRLPESVAEKLRELRNNWYNRKSQDIKQSA